jgi:hypothetical protein
LQKEGEIHMGWSIEQEDWLIAMEQHMKAVYEEIPPPPPRYPPGYPKGPLKSQFFALPVFATCRARLQAAADSHFMHIMPKTSGLHVSAIQNAMDILQPYVQYKLVSTPPDDTENKRTFYGKYTAEKVLQYKTKCSLINRDYQQKVDNIVGIMTMRLIDFHMGELERHYPDIWKDYR